MMLHIELPSKKVLRACKIVVEDCTTDITRLNNRYRDNMVCWRNNGSLIEMLPDQPDVSQLAKERANMETFADMCANAVGYVCVSPELWKAIRRHYRK